jgi:hypothetical protein
METPTVPVAENVLQQLMRDHEARENRRKYMRAYMQERRNQDKESSNAYMRNYRRLVKERAKESARTEEGPEQEKNGPRNTEATH